MKVGSEIRPRAEASASGAVVGCGFARFIGPETSYLQANSTTDIKNNASYSSI